MLSRNVVVFAFLLTSATIPQVRAGDDRAGEMAARISVQHQDVRQESHEEFPLEVVPLGLDPLRRLSVSLPWNDLRQRLTHTNELLITYSIHPSETTRPATLIPRSEYNIFASRRFDILAQIQGPKLWRFAPQGTEIALARCVSYKICVSLGRWQVIFNVAYPHWPPDPSETSCAS
jgi:hypothetical protein